MQSIVQHRSPIGFLTIKTLEDSVSCIEYSSEPLKKIHTLSPFEQSVVSQLESYFAGNLTSFSLPTTFGGTTFQKSVWKELLTIPYGTTKTYKEVAEAIGKPKAVRAVGTACGKNPIPIVIPCHRVVGAHGRVGGYLGGLGKKRWLLNLEMGKM